VCRAAAYARAGHVTARQFCDWLERSARQIGHATVAEGSDVCGNKEGRKREGQNAVQFILATLPNRRPEVDAQRARCHRKELGGMERWKARLSKGQNRCCASAKRSCATADFQLRRGRAGGSVRRSHVVGRGRSGQASHDERSRCENVGRYGGERQSGGRAALL
jgi:hypothetical protein